MIAFARLAIWRGIYKKEFLNNNKIGLYTDLRRFDDLPFKIETFTNAQSVIQPISLCIIIGLKDQDRMFL